MGLFQFKVGLFQFKVGWFKIKARTNLGPQNCMYLSALDLLAETPNVKTPRAFALFCNDQCLVAAVNQSCNKLKVINSVTSEKAAALKLILIPLI